MSSTIFKRVEYDLQTLLSNIAHGSIGLPDIQRPFVWKNVKIRDLFDSMYRGYPIGYLLFWATAPASHQKINPRAIGSDQKQAIPSLVIVDGQQRLTALYAIINGTPVVRSNYKTERIRIAFNPLEQRFEVASAAIRQDKVWIPDISAVWSKATGGILRLVNDYKTELATTRHITDEESMAIDDAIMRLHELRMFPLTSLELSAETSEEAVADVFVRINSTGKALNQADFILTLMSVFWDEGRAELEQFCRDARTPSTGGPSPFNYFIDPNPDQLLRAGIGLAFRRARLQSVYTILRGKDLEANEYSEEAQIAQFERLKKAQGHVVNLQYWHDFLKCIHAAGFRRSIRSGTTLIYCYVLYLIGRTEFRVPEPTLRRAIAQWFFMATITGRYTASAESAMESDLAMLRSVGDSYRFIAQLEHICTITLTEDFWTITLPNELANSSVTSPSLAAYEAAQVILDAPALFSRSKISALIDPAIRASRAAVERHHLWPRAYLAKQDISETRQINQVANYALAEWSDNVRAADHAPVEYLPVLMESYSEAEVAAMYSAHALPHGWETLNYSNFLQQRRDLMAQVVHQGYQKLGEGLDAEFELVDGHDDPAGLIDDGESDSVEFKSTLRVNLHTDQTDKKIEHAVLKTLAAFLNTDGGALVIGVADDGTPVGIEADKFDSEDKMSLHLTNLVKGRMGAATLPLIHQQFDDYEDCRVLRVSCERSPQAVYIKASGDQEQFFIRGGPSTIELTGRQMVDYLKMRFGI